jgi:hypothetical protein
VAVIRSLLVVAEVGVDQCGAVDLVMEEGSEPGKARCLGGACLNPTAGVLTDINSGICADHIRQADQDGGVFIVE